MNKQQSLVWVIVSFALLVLIAVPAAAQPVAYQEPTATAAAQTSSDWTSLSEPPAPMSLPEEVDLAIDYKQPPKDCAVKNDVQETCSTNKRQKTEGFVTIPGKSALVMTGDDIEITTDEKRTVSIVPLKNDPDIHSTLWVVVNTDAEEMKVHIYAPSGSWRGYFSAEEWKPDLVDNLIAVHLQRYTLPVKSALKSLVVPTPTQINPTPVPNCGDSKNGCQVIETFVSIRAGGKLNNFAAIYNEGGTPHWAPITESVTSQ